MQEDFTLKLLCDLIAINSVNPSLVTDGPGEAEIAAAIATVLTQNGIDVRLEEVAPGRPNVVGILEGKTPGPALMLCGHTDTVGVIGMKAPFDPVMRNGRIYGRGSQDMKGGLAAMIGAAVKAANNGDIRTGRVILAAVVDEEYASIGADHLVKTWKADAAVVTEPTDLKIATGHKGFGWAEVNVKGVAAHGSRPKEGKDAILKTGKLLTHLESLDREIQAREKHPLLGTGSLHASLIKGGREWSTYPDHCLLQIERRILTTETMEVILDELQQIIRNLRKEDSEFEAEARFVFGRSAYEIPDGHPLPELLRSTMQRFGKETGIAGMTFWTDAAILGGANIPSVIFGPTGAGLHSVEEYVIADDVLACRDALAGVIQTYCAS